MKPPESEASPPGFPEEKDLARLLPFGLQDYGLTLRTQEKLREERQAGAIADTWLLGEHPFVITQGVRADSQDLKNESCEGLLPAVYKIDRGGMTTLHSPGQLILYPIVRVKGGSLAAGSFSRALVEGARSWLISQFGVETSLKPRHPGLFHEGKKLLSIGISVRGGVTLHGIALNMCNDLDLWKTIVACGDASVSPITLSQILGRRVEPADQTASIRRWLADLWGYRRVELISVDSVPAPA